MSKALLERVDAELHQRRSQVSKLHAQLEDLEDYLDVLEARREAIGKRTHTQAGMKARYGAR
ncbi:MAG: hypothetical protein ACYDH9_00295 [Limisphaerales bacterium]